MKCQQVCFECDTPLDECCCGTDAANLIEQQKQRIAELESSFGELARRAQERYRLPYLRETAKTEELAAENERLTSKLEKLYNIVDALVFGADREISEEHLFVYTIPQDHLNTIGDVMKEATNKATGLYPLADGSLSTDYEVGDQFTGAQGNISVLEENCGCYGWFMIMAKEPYPCSATWNCMIPTEETKLKRRKE